MPAEPGLFRLRDDIEKGSHERRCRRRAVQPVRFMLEVEISTIYKKGDRTRKIHHLIYAPDFATLDRIAERLGRIGNIASDGRPILGLNSRDLLEITLESGPGAYLVPAHIWTPWFAALGSQSGFNSIADCYGDLAEHIFAVETGLSSDPPMNWRISFLDRYRLTSNSDAHSPGKLGREATAFDCDTRLLRHPPRAGDRRRLCRHRRVLPRGGQVPSRRPPQMRRAAHAEGDARIGGRCPVCGEPVTVGVEHRVEVLADRGEAAAPPPATAGEVSSLVPLPEILSEIAASGVGSKTVERCYDRVIGALGPELSILGDVPLEDIARAGSSRARRGDHAAARRPGDPRRRLRRRIRRDPPVRGGRAEARGGGLLFEPPVARRAAPGRAARSTRRRGRRSAADTRRDDGPPRRAAASTAGLQAGR